ncbi:heterokaryon incompatibility protein-domain-containing protein [Xylariomycetidae sp. FL2044]|nr:heterokaryon incompatibility protein-domain-containing protein [Xylariomycetidae sp. FL2044]
MLCQNCEASLKAVAYRVNGEDGREGLFHLSPQSFHESLVAGCFICRDIWLTFLSSRKREVISSQQLHPVPSSFEEFCQVIDGCHTFFDLFGPGKLPWIKTIKKIKDLRDVKIFISIITDNVTATIGRVRLFSDRASPAKYRLRQRCARRCIGQIYIRPELGLYWFRIKHSIFIPDIPRTYYLFPDIMLPNSPNRTTLRAQTPSTGDTSDTWQHWLTTCLNDHSECQAVEKRRRPFSPKRLIQLLQDDQGEIAAWRLVCSVRTGIVPYLTLSHCWGSSQHLCLTRKSYVDFSGSSHISKLPKAYRDACAATHSLGFQYIWIDSLCIFQDNDEDWRTQSAVMGMIYGNAICNIAATWASGADDGCFRARDVAVRRPTFVELETLGCLDKYQIAGAQTYEEDITRAPLNQRGWVLQERYMAKRQLSFARNQTYWECRELVASEQFLGGLPWGFVQRRADFEAPRLDFRDDDEFRKNWTKLVEVYSGCHLSRKSDKLIALSGIVSELQSMTHDTFLGGLWRRDLHLQLCWEPCLPRHDCTTSRGEIASTWSWVNFDGRVRYDPGYDSSFLRKWSRYHLDIVEIPDNAKGRLVLRGLAVQGRVTVHNAPTLIYKRLEYDLLLEDELLKVTGSLADSRPLEINMVWDEDLVRLDAEPDRRSELVERRNSELTFLMVRLDFRPRNNRCFVGLVLRILPSLGEARQYVRMGMFNTNPSDNAIPELLASRLGLRAKNSKRVVDVDQILEHTNLRDPRIADLVHTVTVV